jgi:hypothetical protein
VLSGNRVYHEIKIQPTSVEHQLCVCSSVLNFNVYWADLSPWAVLTLSCSHYPLLPDSNWNSRVLVAKQRLSCVLFTPEYTHTVLMSHLSLTRSSTRGTRDVYIARSVATEIHQKLAQKLGAAESSTGEELVEPCKDHVGLSSFGILSTETDIFLRSNVMTAIFSHRFRQRQNLRAKHVLQQILPQI